MSYLYSMTCWYEKPFIVLQFLVSLIQPAWITFLSHEQICHNDALLECVLPLLQAVSKTLVKVCRVDLLSAV